MANYLLKTTGEIKVLEDEVELAELQKAVGGYIELVRTPHGDLFVNEDGLRLQLPNNATATWVSGRQIVGDCVLTTSVPFPASKVPG